ncbi:MAG: ABC transporter ATP-binding protein [Ruminococcus sp.]
MNLVFDKVTKKYGDLTALDNFSYTFSSGVYGLLGPNGAGKSTMMNLIVGNIKLSSGTIQYDGQNTIALGAEYRKLIGFMPQQQGIYPDFTLERFLWYMASLKGIHKDEARKQIPELIQAVNLQDFANRRLGGFSGGMKQRALIAQAMLGSPKILILDEPTAGLDPKERIRIRNLISKLALNQIVIIATHVVSDVAFIAKEILLMKKGVLIDSGSPHKLCKSIEGKVFELPCQEDDIEKISSMYKVSNLSREKDDILVRVLNDDSPLDYAYTSVKPDLEDLYLWYFD